VASVSSTTTYSVTVTDAGGCPATDEVSILIYPVNASAGNSVTICQGGTVTLNASGGNSYSWYPSAFLNTTTIANPTASPTVTITYYAKITDTAGCYAIDSVKVFVDSCFVGVTEENISTYINIYPNPSTGIFTLQMPEGEIEIYNALGENIYSSKIFSKASEIDLDKQQNGIYFLRLKTEKGIETRKIILTR
jgi:hypothetical protein